MCTFKIDTEGLRSPLIRSHKYGPCSARYEKDGNLDIVLAHESLGPCVPFDSRFCLSKSNLLFVVRGPRTCDDYRERIVELSIGFLFRKRILCSSVRRSRAGGDFHIEIKICASLLQSDVVYRCRVSSCLLIFCDKMGRCILFFRNF